MNYEEGTVIVLSENEKSKVFILFDKAAQNILDDIQTDDLGRLSNSNILIFEGSRGKRNFASRVFSLYTPGMDVYPTSDFK